MYINCVHAQRRGSGEFGAPRILHRSRTSFSTDLPQALNDMISYVAFTNMHPKYFAYKEEHKSDGN
jgi:hypothetical protein